ncbi:hypothetical protein CHU98_g1850 [Xylaria longipes]|nr:hypothetical protein CHU98_g1850 [Xylaria longipes]
MDGGWWMVDGGWWMVDDDDDDDDDDEDDDDLGVGGAPVPRGERRPEWRVTCRLCRLSRLVHTQARMHCFQKTSNTGACRQCSARPDWRIADCHRPPNPDKPTITPYNNTALFTTRSATRELVSLGAIDGREAALRSCPRRWIRSIGAFELVLLRSLHSEQRIYYIPVLPIGNIVKKEKSSGGTARIAYLYALSPRGGTSGHRHLVSLSTVMTEAVAVSYGPEMAPVRLAIVSRGNYSSRQDSSDVHVADGTAVGNTLRCCLAYTKAGWMTLGAGTSNTYIFYKGAVYVLRILRWSEKNNGV